LSTVLAVMAVVLHAAGAALPAPPHPADAVSWWRSHDPLLAVASLTRVLALVVVGHLAATTALSAVALAIRSPQLAAWAQRLSPRRWAAVLRPLVVVAGVAVAPATSAGATPAGAVSVTADPDPAPLELRLVPSPGSSTWVMALLDPVAESRPNGDAAASPTPAPTGAPAAAITTESTLTADPGAPGASATDDTETTGGGITRRAAPGDSLWSLSADRLAEVAGRAVTPGEVAPYWRDVIAANAATIADPGLVFVGQAVRLPAPQLP